MPDVEICGTTVRIQRFTLAKAMRVVTLLQLIQKKVPEIAKHWAEYRRDYSTEYSTEIERNRAIVLFPQLNEIMKEADWERAGHKYYVPGQPSQTEIFFEMAPLVYERAEEVTLRLLGLIAMDNEIVNRYVKQGDIWDRVDELVDEIIRPAALDEILELLLTAAEVIDGQVLQKAKTVGDRAGNVAQLLGWSTKSETSTTSNGSPEQLNTVSYTPSLDNSDGPPTSSTESPGISSVTSKTNPNESTESKVTEKS